MSATATRKQHTETLFIAFELGWTEWKLGFTRGLDQEPELRSIPARKLARLGEEIARAKERWRLPARCRVVSCYEAGRDGFWLHRYLSASGIENHVVGASSIEVKRQRRRAKTDRIDGRKLATMLVRWDLGEKTVWSVVQVPSVEEEDQRHLHRELTTLKREQTRQINRVKGLLASQGLRIRLRRDFESQLDRARLWDGSPVPEGLRLRIQGEYERLEFVRGQIVELEKERLQLLRESNSRSLEQVRDLARLRGISKAGNARVRAMAVEIAWRWLQFQPESELAQWYERRFGSGSSRMKRVGIVALARKLLVALWRYLDQGIIPAGAVFKPEGFRFR